jgi:hypothetical protein
MDVRGGGTADGEDCQYFYRAEWATKEDGGEHARAKGDWLAEAGLRKDGCQNLVEDFWGSVYAEGKVRGERQEVARFPEYPSGFSGESKGPAPGDHLRVHACGSVF